MLCTVLSTWDAHCNEVPRCTSMYVTRKSWTWPKGIWWRKADMFKHVNTSLTPSLLNKWRPTSVWNKRVPARACAGEETPFCWELLYVSCGGHITCHTLQLVLFSRRYQKYAALPAAQTLILFTGYHTVSPGPTCRMPVSSTALEKIQRP